MQIITAIFSVFIVLTPGMTIPDGAELIGELIHDFELFDYQRNIHTLYQYKGDPILLAFWYPGDENCTNALLALEKVYKNCKDQGLKVIAVDILARTNEALLFFGNHDLSYIFLEGIYNHALEDYKIEGVPSIFLIDRDMKVLKYFAGYDAGLAQRLDNAVQPLLKPLDP